ncbi:MAG: thioesterase family protein, partial [Nocardioidaceae bacterium]
ASPYTVECHIHYLAECSLGQVLSASTIIVAADAKKMRLYTELLHEDRRTAATGEFLYLHVDTALGATTAMPSDRHDRVQEMLFAHASCPTSRPPRPRGGSHTLRLGGQVTNDLNRHRPRKPAPVWHAL